MTYTKQTWATGDVITAQKLNHMEDGIAGGTLVIGGFSYSYDSESETFTGTSDKTWQEINDALAAGARCVVVHTVMDGPAQLNITAAALIEGKYKIIGDNNFGAETTSADGYPTAGGIE